MKRLTGWMVAAVVLGGAGVGWGQEERPPAEVVTRTYNVADIVRTAPDYPFDSAVIPPTIDPQNRAATVAGVTRRGLLGWGQQEEGAPAKAGIGMEQLRVVIQRTVDPGSWRWDPQPNGTGGERTKEMVGTAQPLGTLLIVTQTAENQKRVQGVLDAIRAEYGPLKGVGVSVRWLVLDAGQARQLIGDQQKGAVAVVDGAAVEKLPAGAVWGSARTACFSGQTVSMSSGRGRTWLYHASPVVGTNAVAYDPETQLVQSGAVLQVTPLLASDGKTAVLDVASVATDWSPMEGQVRVGGAVGDTTTTTRPVEQLTAPVDRLNVGVQQMRTTVRVPVGKMVVVGGMTKEPGVDGREMYLLAEVRAE